MEKLIINLLRHHGFEAWVSGETSRDIFLQRKPTKYHISVKATLADLKNKLSSKIKEINEYHTYILLEYKNNIYYIYPLKKVELINTYYNVSYTDILEEDAKSRDFTIHCLYYNPIDNIWIDPLNIKKDIIDKKIKFVGDPITKILESKIRLLQAPVLKHILGKDQWFIESNTKNAIKSESLKLYFYLYKKYLIKEEVEKVLLDSNEPSSFFYDLKELNLLNIIFPELCHCVNIEQDNKASNFNLFQHLMMTLDIISQFKTGDDKNNLILLLSALLHDIGKPYTMTNENGKIHFYQHEYVGAKLADVILSRWGFPNDIIHSVKNLIINHLFEIDASKNNKYIMNLITKVGPNNIHNLLRLRYADRLGNYRTNISMKNFNKFKIKVNKLLEKKYPEHFELNLTDDEIEQIIKPITDNYDEVLLNVKAHLKVAIKHSIIPNNKSKLQVYLSKLFSINCPLDLNHLLQTWSSIYEGNKETFPNGKLKCGLYCNFTCDESNLI